MLAWLIPILSLIGSALVSAIIGIIVKRVETAADKKRAENLQYREEHFAQEEEQKFNKLKNELGAELKAVVQPLDEKIDKLSQNLEDDRAATITTIRSKMKTLRDQYKEQGFADVGDKATWKELYDHYKKMGGNHFKDYVDQWKLEVEKLPLEPPKDKQDSTKKYVHD